ncbi:hypothetical protein PR202_gb07847 [Eleusine coracana subsp. coracana]|uniref:Uncharacterized protein n=1 Tax=Eleusine coracana subsp. coracana TaxID=191504 RepID=A0AAV5EDC6_ELECO|nr:hypothetical protein PR202_gb07847 [Eleusine coracana subsp. coracana]
MKQGECSSLPGVSYEGVHQLKRLKRKPAWRGYASQLNGFAVNQRVSRWTVHV